VQLWDTATGQRVGRSLPHNGPVLAVAFRPDGKILATACDDGKVQLWDAETLESRGPALPHPNEVRAVAFRPDGKVLATACPDGRVLLFDATTSKPIGPPLQHKSAVVDVCFSPDGTIVATACHDSTAQLWDATTQTPLGPPLQHQNAVTAVALRHDGKVLATASFDRTVRFWDIAPLTPVEPTRLPLPVPLLLGTGTSRDGTLVVWPIADGSVQLLDAVSRQPVGLLRGHQLPVLVADFRPDGKVLATGSEDRTVRLWDVATFLPLGHPLEHKGSLLAVAFSPDGKVLATLCSDFTAQLWDAATCAPLGGPLPHQGKVGSFAFRPDGKVLATGGDRTVELWDAVTAKSIGRLQHEGVAPALAFHPDGKVLAIGSMDRTVRFWDTATGKPVGPGLWHQGQVLAVSYSSDGTLLATAGGAKTAQLWDTATSKPIGPPMPHPGLVKVVSFRPDGKALRTVTDDATARLWDVPAPLAGEPDQIVLWAEALAGMKLDAGDDTSVLDARESEQRRVELEQNDASPRLIAHSPEWEAAWQERVIASSESSSDWFAALWHLDRVIAARPMDASLAARRGDVLFRLERWVEAEQDYSKAIRLGALGPDYPAVHYARGLARARLHRWAEADADFVVDIEQWRGDSGSSFIHALLRLHLDDIDGYRDACERMLARWAGSLDLESLDRLTLALTYAPDAVADWNWPIRLAQRRVNGDPTNWRYHEILGLVYYRAGEYDRALAALETSARLLQEPEGSIWARLFLAMVHDRLGHQDVARKLLDSAIAWIDREVPDLPDGSSRNPSIPWSQRLVFSLLRREAEAQIKKGRPLYLPANVFQEPSVPDRSPASPNW
jgi:WD40 repeat protein/tetratricopeptide (TPR) repeat protein